ncbi:hypothetical protein ACKI2C_49050, partial [Streptomyces brasiliscabiei]
ANFGLGTEQNYYENLESWSSPFNTVMTMYDAKQMLYNTIYDMLFNDKSSGYNHAMSLLGLNVYNYENMSTEYFAVSFDKYGNIHLAVIRPEVG